MRVFVPCRCRASLRSSFFTKVFGTPRTFKIPDSAASNGKGLYKVKINFPVDQKLFLVMSDATGFGSGGTSSVTQVGSSVGGKSCNTTDPGVDFAFNLDSALTQCRQATPIRVATPV